MIECYPSCSANNLPRSLARNLALALVLGGFCSVKVFGQIVPLNPPTESQRFVYEIAPSGISISIVHGASAPTVRRDGRDILISFASALPSFDAATLQARSAAWIEGISVGYDSLLIRLAEGAMAEVSHSTTHLELKITAKSAEAEQEKPPDLENVSTPNDRTGALRLRLLRAQLMLQNQQLALARGSFTRLREILPERPEPATGLAAVEWQAGKWRRSLELYREATALGGETPDLISARAAVERTQASRVSVGLDERRSYGGTLTAPVKVTLAELKGVQRLNEAWRINLEADWAQVRTDAVRRTNGVIEAFSGQRSRGLLAAQHDAVNGAVTTGSLFLGSSASGLGFNYRRPDDRGSTHIALEGRRENWDYVEGLVDGATRDRFAIGRTQRFTADFAGRIEIGANRYRRENEGQLGRSTSVAAELRLNRLGGVAGLSTIYSINGEYVSDQTTRISANGERFAPLPLVNREVHSLTLGYVRRSKGSSAEGVVIFDGYAGFGSDRYGLSGEIAGASLSYVKGPVEFSFRLNHVRNVGRSRGTSDSVGAMITFFF
jgi:hypothetical protein